MKSVETLVNNVRKTKIDISPVKRKLQVEEIGVKNVPALKDVPEELEEEQEQDTSFKKRSKTDVPKLKEIPATLEIPAKLHFDQEEIESPKSAKDNIELLSSIPDIILPVDRHSKEKDLFRSYFCRHFDSILKINKNEALNLEKQIIDPIVLELKDYVNMESVQQNWALLKTYTLKDKILLKLLMVWRWLKRAAIFIFVDILFEFLKNFFTNQFVIIFIETILAIIYVVYSEPSYVLYPIILWIFVNVYPKFDSILALNMKIWLLMIPTGINSLIAKKQVDPELTMSTNKDFNFKETGEYNLFDISTLGVILMSFVILEMIIMSSKNSLEKSSVNTVDLPQKEVQKGSSTFLMIVNLLYSNSLYLIMINIYVIALDINVISLGLIIFFIILILVHQVGQKTFYTLFWYNQVSILLRYIYNQHKQGTEEKSSLYRLIGVEESDNMSTKTKFLLNFSLQLLLIIVIFSNRNKEAIGLIQKEEKEHSASRRAFGGESGFKRIFKNFLELVKFGAFHCLPWLAYLVIYLAMVITTTSIVTLLELFVLSYLFVNHCQFNVEQRFGGLNFMRGAWRGMILFCAIMALSRYSLWFITQQYLQEKFTTVKSLHDFISLNLGFMGLLPTNLSQAYLELLPSFLSMYLGSLVLHRIKMIEYTLRNHDEIMKLDILEADEVPTIELVKVENKIDDDQLSNKPPSDEPEVKIQKRFTIFGKRPTRRLSDELKAKLRDQAEQAKMEERQMKLCARREVMGDINMLR